MAKLVRDKSVEKIPGLDDTKRKRWAKIAEDQLVETLISNWGAAPSGESALGSGAIDGRPSCSAWRGTGAPGATSQPRLKSRVELLAGEEDPPVGVAPGWVHEDGDALVLASRARGTPVPARLAFPISSSAGYLACTIARRLKFLVKP